MRTRKRGAGDIADYPINLSCPSSETFLGFLNGYRRNVDDCDATISKVAKIINQCGGTAPNVQNSRGLRQTSLFNQLP